MATLSQSRAVKSLNNGEGRKRFVFKNFAQRIEDIDIDVYRNLDPLKLEPSEGSSFFRDYLVQWRELNTAEDFISFYEEMLPLVQTLPLVILHKELILSKLLSSVKLKARLSLEPILRLIAALSRDVLEDFLPFLPRIADSFVSLLKNGGDKEPEIIEQIFTSWSYVMMNLHKYLISSVVYALKVTVSLRYYPKGYIQEFMAESLSFLLRNAPTEQLIKGVRKIMFEVAKKPVVTRRSGVSALLWFTMRGTSSRLHSRADQVFRLLTDSSILSISDKFIPGSDTVVEVISSTFVRLCEELDINELNLMWDCLYHEINTCITAGSLSHLKRLLSLLISPLKMNAGCNTSDFRPIIELVNLLVQKVVVPTFDPNAEDCPSDVVDVILQLMLCILDALQFSNETSVISDISSQWAAVFQLKNSSLLNFIKDMIQKDPCTLYAFREYIISAMNDLIDISEEEVIDMIMCLGERMQEKQSGFFLKASDNSLSKIQGCLQNTISRWIRIIKDIDNKDTTSFNKSDAYLPNLWVAVRCFPHVIDISNNWSLLMELVDALDQLLKTEPEGVAGHPAKSWQSLIGAALSSYCKLHFNKETKDETTIKFLHLAKRFKLSSQVLSSVAEYLDLIYGPVIHSDPSFKLFHPDLKREMVEDAVGIFAENLCNSDKRIRVSTLRILCHYEPLTCEFSTREQPVAKKMRREVSQTSHTETIESNVIQLLLSIEETPISISTSRKVVLLVSRIQMALSSGGIPEPYIPIVLNGIIGIFYNRFTSLWDPAFECLAVLISNHATLVWKRFVYYLEQCQSTSFSPNVQANKEDTESANKSSDMVERFDLFVTPASDSTSCATVLSLLLQSLQRVPTLSEPQFQQIIHLFLMFLGYHNEDPVSVGSYKIHVCKGKEWKGVLKDWLNLLKLRRNSKSFNQNQFLKEVLITRFLDENDAEIQTKVLDLLLLWKDDFLLPYDQHLKKLIISKNLREELTVWSISKGADLVSEQHRPGLVPFVIRLLVPKVRNLKMFASRKHASVLHRRAVLSFISQLEVDELPLFYALLVKPLLTTSTEIGDSGNWFWGSQWNSILDFQAADVLKYFTMDIIMALSWKKKNGFVHVIEEVIKVFDHTRIVPFLDLLMGCVVRIIESCTFSLHGGKSHELSIVDRQCNVLINSHEKDSALPNQIMTNTTMKQYKDLRSLCLKIVSLVLNKYEDHDFGAGFWDLFFLSVRPLVDSFKQEGSSSEKPSSLFSCFIAMSRSDKLVSLLCKESNLVPDIFSILTVKTATEAILSCVLEFIGNLLSLDSEMDEEDKCTKRIIPLNLETLICSLHHLFQSDSLIKRKLVKCPGARELGIFKLLSKYINDHLLAGKFIDILLPFLEKRTQNSDACQVAVQVIRDIIPVSGRENTEKIIRVVSPLLITAEQELRVCICDLLHVLAGTDPSIALMGGILKELNAISVIDMGDLDYDTIVDAYAKITPTFFYTFREDHTAILLSQCIYDMSSEEIILRHSAYRSLQSFVEFSSLILGSDVNNHPEENGATKSFVADGQWTCESIQRTINRFLLKHMGEAMNKESPVQKLWMELLREMVLKLPELPNLKSLKALSSVDVEVDFFNNIVHIQKHRRAKALLRFRNVLNAGNLSEDITRKIFVPLFLNLLFNVQDGKGEHVRNACVEALAAVSHQMEWKAYYALLNKCLREMTLKPDKQKILSRLICFILDKFHFSELCCTEEAIDSTSDSSIKTTEIQSSLQKCVLPKLQKLLSSDSDKVNVNISLAVLKLLKLLPGDIMESQLPSIIHRISNFLKNRMESIRDEARSALAACLKELGLEYLQFVINVLRSILKRGFEVHVLGYTLNFIMAKTLLNSPVGKLDYCLKDLLSIVENDILGDVSEEKEVDKIASKMKETRKCKSLETLKLISQSITFKTHAVKLLLPITNKLQKHVTTKVKSKLEKMLDDIAAGIECNPSADQSDVFIFVYRLIGGRDAQDIEPEKNLSVGETTNDFRLKACSNIRKDSGSQSQGFHLITVFALGVLSKRIKNIKLDKKNEELISMLDPFVELLGNFLSSKYDDVLSASLKCLHPLIKFPLPSLETQADELKTALLDTAQSSINTNSPLMESCLKLLTLLLRSTKITLSTDQLRVLIQFPMFIDIERKPSILALSLLKAIINRKLVVPEIYDIVTQAAELIVTSQNGDIRKKCSEILLQFLFDYHLSKKRLQQHFDFLIKNLRYEHSSGREAVLEMFHAIIMKFPISVVDDLSQTLFIHLVGCLANDHDSKVRSMTGAALKLLVGHVSPHSLNTILAYSLSWYMGEKQKLWSSAAQILGLVVESTAKEFRKHVDSVLPVIRSILQSSISVVSTEKDFSDEPTIPFWKEAYYSLVLLEKILHQFHELCLDKAYEDIWDTICEFLLHPHLWLRNISSRLVSFYFSAVTESCKEIPGRSIKSYSLMRPSRLFTLAVYFCCQLKAQVVDEDANNLITQNLVFAICGTHSLFGQEALVDPLVFWSTMDQHDQAEFLKAFSLLDPRKGKSIFASLISTDRENNDDLRYVLVSNLLKRMGKAALLMEAIQMKIVFNSFNAIASEIGQNDCQRYAPQMLLPLYKVCEGFAGKAIPDDVKQLAQGVCKNMTKALGTQNFVLVYNQIRKNLKAKRDKRREEQRVMAVTNPMRNAKRKLRAAAKHQANKKRKIMTMKMGRYARK